MEFNNSNTFNNVDVHFDASIRMHGIIAESEEQARDIATVTGIRQEYMKAFGGVRHLFRLDFGKSILFAFDIEMNGGEYLREILNPTEKPNYSASEKSGVPQPSAA